MPDIKENYEDTCLFCGAKLAEGYFPDGIKAYGNHSYERCSCVELATYKQLLADAAVIKAKADARLKVFELRDDLVSERNHLADVERLLHAAERELDSLLEV